MLKKTECEFECNKDIALLTSVRIPTTVRAVACPDSEEKLVALVDELRKNEIPFITVGRMSNILFKNGSYNGVVIRTSKIKGKTKAENRITLSCGESLANAISYMSRFDMGGLEGLFAIPGSVGGMVRQNAGAYGYEIKDRFVSARCYIPNTGDTVDLTVSDMNFTYRNSTLSANGAILLSATFDFVYKRREDIIREISEYRVQRAKSQPIGIPSLGSVFKRYRGVGAGYYIDRAGLKGFAIGGARVSEKHAGFIINTGGATADEYLRLVDYVKSAVYSAFGIELEEEIEII